MEMRLQQVKNETMQKLYFFEKLEDFKRKNLRYIY